MRTRLQDVAKVAGVSVATVDRVINCRAGVRAETMARVEQTLATLGYAPSTLSARKVPDQLTLGILLPEGDNAFMEHLSCEFSAAKSHALANKMTVRLITADVFSPQALSNAIHELAEQVDGAAIVALDDPLVCAAIDDLAASSIPVITLVSDAPQSKRARYVGLQNGPAGRTAGALLGRFTSGRTGRIGMIAGSVHLRDHVERQAGFEQVIGRDFPHLTVLPVREARDDFERVEDVTQALIAENPDLIGIYNVGAGNRGVIRALESTHTADRIVFVGHELTDHTRRALLRGTMDAVISQDAGHEARSTLRILEALCRDHPLNDAQERIGIDIHIKDNLP